MDLPGTKLGRQTLRQVPGKRKILYLRSNVKESGGEEKIECAIRKTIRKSRERIYGVLGFRLFFSRFYFSVGFIVVRVRFFSTPVGSIRLRFDTHNRITRLSTVAREREKVFHLI